MAITDKLAAVADAIRGKTGKAEKMTLDQMPGEIEGIQAGGGGDLKALVERTITEFPDLEGLGVIGRTAFNGCTRMGGSKFPTSVYSIGDFAFDGCENISFAELNDNVTCIGISAFKGCRKLQLKKLPDSLARGGWIPTYAFQNCASMPLESLPSTISGFAECAFEGCTSLAITHMPKTVGVINRLAFNNCTGLTSITFDGKPNSISGDAFNGCVNIHTINVPWAEGEVANAPWGATNATINYNYVEG